jgi:hypothetical protein
MSTMRAESRPTARHPVGSFPWAEAILVDTGRLTPEHVALVFEKNPDTPLTRTLKHYLVRLKRRERRSGVKPRNAAAWEFILFDAKALYETKLQEARLQQRSGIGPVRDAQSSEMATERACKAVLQEMRTRNVDWMTLRNLLSLRIREPELFFDDRDTLSIPQEAAA